MENDIKVISIDVSEQPDCTIINGKSFIIVCGRGNNRSIGDSNKILQQIAKEEEEAIQRLRQIHKKEDDLVEKLRDEIDELYTKQIEVEKQCKYRQKIPLIFSKSIRSQKPSKKPYIKRLRRVIRM